MSNQVPLRILDRLTRTSPRCDLEQLTYDVVSELVLCDVIEQRGEDRQQGHGSIVNILRYALHRLDTEKY